MRTQSFHAARLVELFRSRKIATMRELKVALGTQVDITVFRKLKELGYRTSYSHRGGYYTLNEIALFNDMGLWSFRSVWFSRYGTLIKTCESLVSGSQAGYFAEELDNVLHVETKAALLNLFRGGEVGREEVSRRYLYCSVDWEVGEHQLAVRRLEESKSGLGRSVLGGEEVPDELRARVILYFSLLDERQRRCTPVWSLSSSDMGVIGRWRSFLGWILIRLAEAGSSCWPGSWRGSGPASRERGGNLWKKNARSDRAH